MSGASWVRIGAILGAIGVTAGAFGAHGLKPSDDALKAMSSPDREASEKRMATFETGARYHMYHAFAIVGVGLVAAGLGKRGPLLDVAGWCFIGGVLLFSGPLYGIGVGGPRWLGAIAPIGGVLMILGWVVLAFGTMDSAKPRIGQDV